MNNFFVEIYNNQSKQYEPTTGNAVFTPKVANLLDEQLDEATLSLKHDSTAYYKPFTRVKISFVNKPECFLDLDKAEAIIDKTELTGVESSYSFDSSGKLTQTYTLYMFVANDRAIETPVGSNLYNHELYLIELTKLMERYIGDSLTFTNSLGNNYSVANGGYAAGYYTLRYEDGTTSNGDFISTIFPIGKIISDGKIQVLQPLEIIQNEKGLGSLVTNLSAGFEPASDGIIEFLKDSAGDIITTQTPTIYQVTSGTYQIQYSFILTMVSVGILYTRQYNITYTFSAVLNRLPLKKWTVTDVINRIFDLIEPLEITRFEYVPTTFPKFRLQGVQYDADGQRLLTYTPGSQAEKLNKILAPEFSFTRETLREMLQQIGGFVHGEPRITGEKIDEHNKSYFEVAFDFYGQSKKSNISSNPYITATFGTDVNQYCTALDSSADNLTNTLDWAQGVIVEPFYDFYKSLRTEQTTARLSESDGTFISTQLPINIIKSVKCRYIPALGVGDWDITPYIFEQSDYNLLSSYEGAYPFGKNFALYYTQGQRNIKGLFFKAEHAVNPIFHNYSIVNILRAVTGNNSLKIEGQELMLLAFSVTYLPIYSARVKTHKQYVEEGLPSVLAYNQSANMIETRYYGEHLKGAVERLGNIEKTYTYHLAWLSEIPNIGTKFDEQYFISNVSWEFLPFYIKCTIGLSKHFNRKSQYIGINSQKRMWEISERQAQIRQSIYPIYILVSDKQPDNEEGSYRTLLGNPATLLLDKSINVPISVAEITTLDIGKNGMYRVALPVIASAFGNSMTFTYAFEDNYSAGQKVVQVQGDGTDTDNVTGLWGANVPYTDYYGRVYYIECALIGGIPRKDNNGYLDLPQISGYLLTDKELLRSTYLYRKDNREIPQITHEIAVVTDNENIIIGSALCKNCSAVNSSPKDFEIYAFKENLNVIENKVDLTNALRIAESNEITITNNSIEIPAINNAEAEQYIAWAIVTKPITTEIAVSDESGAETTQTIIEGSELLLGQNNCQLTEPKYLYFNLRRKIYE